MVSVVSLVSMLRKQRIRFGSVPSDLSHASTEGQRHALYHLKHLRTRYTRYVPLPIATESVSFGRI